MALTQENLDYLKLIPVLKTLPKRAFQMVYDYEADVLYIDFYNPPHSSDDTELMDNDILIRYGEKDEIVGFTILHASTR
jgi:uncharacterized protein YuzE